MSRSKALIGIALIFFFGIVVGVALSVRLSMVRVKNLASGTPDELAILTVARIDKAVRFTLDQRVKAREIVREAERQIAARQETLAPEIESITTKARRELLTLMTPQQLQKLPSNFHPSSQQTPQSSPSSTSGH